MAVMWTPENINKLGELWQDGFSDAEIAARMNTTIAAIKTARTCHRFVKGAARSYSTTWTDAEKATFARMYSNGAKVREIASVLGKTANTVYQYAYRQGAKRYGKGGGLDLTDGYIKLQQDFLLLEKRLSRLEKCWRNIPVLDYPSEE